MVDKPGTRITSMVVYVRPKVILQRAGSAQHRRMRSSQQQLQLPVLHPSNLRIDDAILKAPTAVVLEQCVPPARNQLSTGAEPELSISPREDCSIKQAANRTQFAHADGCAGGCAGKGAELYSNAMALHSSRTHLDCSMGLNLPPRCGAIRF